MPKPISFLITYYNEKELLTECLHSVQRTSPPPFEILIYDDASQFSARDFIPSGMEVRILRGETNRGPSFGRNQLLAAAQGEFIHFQDADDVVYPEWGSRVQSALEDGVTDVVLTEIRTVKEGRVLADRVLGLSQLSTNPDLVAFCLQGSIITNAGIYRKSRAVLIGGYSEKLWQSEDLYFHAKLAASGVHYKVINDPMVENRIRAGSRSQNFVEVWNDTVRALRMLKSELPARYTQDLSNAAARAGAVLYRLGAKGDAHKAFQLAEEMGTPQYLDQSRLYRTVAQLLGPASAEKIGALYRSLLPTSLRHRLR